MAMSVVNLLSSLLSIMIMPAAASTHSGDEAALLSFKAEASDPGSGVLTSWNSNTSFCSWEGVTCSRRRSQPRVLELSLFSRGLTGTLSPAIGNLTLLQKLNLSYNSLYGEIPPSIGRLGRLERLDLSNNSFSGTLPANLSACISMKYMDLDDNQLGGHIPAVIGDTLTHVKVLSLRDNRFMGTIPESLANLSSLIYLSASGNQLEGTVPPGLGSIAGLEFLSFSLNNLSGMLPHSLYNFSSLVTFSVEVNMLHGSIPANIGDKFPSIQELILSSNQFSGTIPSSLANLSTLTGVYLSTNKFTGFVPPTLGRLQALTYLDLYDNLLKANDKEGWEFITSLANCSQLQELDLSNNSFSGSLPGPIVNLSTSLQKLYLSYNRIYGNIPSDIGNLVNLSILDIGNTSIFGVIPDNIGKLANLVGLGLYNTRLSGLIPSSIGNITTLGILWASNNNLEGPIPASLGKLKNVFVLDLSRNRLNDSIPKEILELPALSFSLDLSYNLLSGTLPSEVGSLANLNQFNLSGNQLSGPIPDSIGNCKVLESLLLDNNLFDGSIPQSLKNIKGLSVLNLTINKLSGGIPNSLANIGNLQELYLAHNNLSGPIPTNLQNLTSLLKLDVSFNDLQGRVPKDGVFRNLSYLSVVGNEKLCGGAPQLHLSPCSMRTLGNQRKASSKSLIVALVTTGAILSSLLVLILILLLYKKLKRAQKDQQSPLAIEEQYQRVSYYALLKGTNGFSEANFLGKGSFGTVYKCILDEEGTTTAVKVFNLQQSGSSKSFEAECEALRQVRHRCLVKIITCCSSIDPQGQEFKALVFEFMPNGSLNDWLHPISGNPSLSNTLSLAQRLDIAVDIVDALDYLHNHCQPSVIHCDLKPSNILLAQDMSARVGDFGISRVLTENANLTSLTSISSIGIRGSIGYIAPEYGEGCTISAPGDVYSLGILLLEMFTGRSPTDDMLRDSSLHRFAEMARLPDRVMESADPTIWMHVEANNRGDDDTNLVRSRIEDCLVSVTGLGISCSKLQPRERISMRDAAVEMHAIRDSYLIFGSGLQVSEYGTKKTTTFGDLQQ